MKYTIATKDMVNNWEKTGLLKGLSEMDSFRLALILENGLDFMKTNELSEFAKSTFLPLITRIFREQRQIEINFGLLLNLINESVKNYNPDGFITHLDAETEMCLKISELYLKNN